MAAITEADIKLLASERLNDDADGGGFMTGVVVPDGVENNLFPDIADTDRVFGRVQMRKCYVAVTNDQTDVYMGAHVILDDTPDDAAATALIVTKAGYAQQREDMVETLNISNYKVASGAQKVILGPDVLSATVSDQIKANFQNSSGSYWDGTGYQTWATVQGLAVGDLLGLFTVNAGDPIPAVDTMEIVAIQALAGATSPQFVLLDLEQPVQRSYNANVDNTWNSLNGIEWYSSTPGLNDYCVKLEQDLSAEGGALRFYGQTTTTAQANSGATTLAVASTWARYIPVPSGGSYPTVAPEILGVDPAPYVHTVGRVQTFRGNDAMVIHHTQDMSPQTVSNAQTVNTGRTGLAKVRVYGNDGAEIAAGFTVDLAAGTVTFDDVSGYSQPVTVRHRIENMRLVLEASEKQLKLARALDRTFPAGSKVSSVLMLGDLQARVHPGWQQQTWTGVFSNAPIGAGISADYNEAFYPIAVTNAGAITERWAIVFTTSTNFRVIGEQVGEILQGNTASACAPLNPATLEPFFSIPAAGWGGGWAAGNVYRFNTTGANAPVWLIRSIAPSAPYGLQDSMSLAIRGNVDAS